MYYCMFNKINVEPVQSNLICSIPFLFLHDNSKANETESLTSEHSEIRKEISDLSKKVCSMNENLQKELKSTDSSITQSSVPTAQSTSAAWSVIDKISNRDSCKNNLIM